ncbi:MAG: SRPBCC domain-containing protein [Anaerolineales bacterium]
MKTQALKFKRTIAQPPSEVYRMLTRASLLRTWLCDAAQLDARKGGRVYLYWNAGYAVTGECTAAEPGKKVAFTWQGKGDPGPSQAVITLKGNDGSTAVTLTHEVGTGKAWKATTEGMGHEWNNGLDNLKSVLETGEDLRLVRRPMLGITGMAQNDAETAAKLGMPVTTGIRIGGTVPGMGAEAAGLQADDVIVGMGKTKVQRFPQLTASLSQHKAGDTIPVMFYRGQQKHVLPMTLSRRPPVPMPATGMELAARAREMFERDDAELAQLFENVSEEDAGCRPAPDEWSAKDVLAHIIQSERGALDFHMQVVSDSEPWFDDFDNELHARPLGLRRLFPTVQALLDELKRAEAETVAFLEALPPEYIAQKRNYWRLCQNFYLGPTHVQTHADQIRKAIAAARKM